MTRWSRIAGFAAALVIAMGSTACGGAAVPSGSDAGKGQRVIGPADAVSGTAYQFSVPGGEVELVVSKPADRVPGADGQEHAAPDGMEYVGFDGEFRPGAGMSSTVEVLTDNKRKPFTVTLHADGKAMSLSESGRGLPLETFVPVRADAELRVDLEFDGESQELNLSTGDIDAGLAVGLRNVEPQGPTTCRDQSSSPSAEVIGTCNVTRWNLPYLAGQGWSEQGWSVVQIDRSVEQIRANESVYLPGEFKDRSRIEGDLVKRRVLLNKHGDFSVWLIAEGDAGALQIGQSAIGERFDGSGDFRQRFRFSGKG